MYIIINIYFTALTLIFLIFLMAVYFSKKSMNNIENKIYRQLLIWNFIEVVCHFGLYYCVGYVRDNMFLILSFLKIYLVATVNCFALLGFYLFAVARPKPEEFEASFRKNRKKYLSIILGIALLMDLPILLSDVHFEFTEDLFVTAGLPTVVLYIVLFSSVFIGTYIIIKNQKTTPFKKILPFYMLGGLIVVYFFTTLILPFLCAVIVLLTLTSYLMFHTIENPDIKLIAQLELAKTQAEKSNEAKSDFLSSMSHEIRTPLNAIVGLSQMIADGDNIDTMRTDSKDILVASQNLLEIVNGILDINKLEANKMEIIESSYNTEETFESVLKMIRIRMAGKPIELRVHYSENLPSVLFGDKEKLKQILTNLLTNAVKYTEKGFIDFTVDSRINKDRCELTISVKDTGRGIKEDQKEMLFTKFNRLEEDKDTDIEGTGLGLAITKSLLQILDGKITVESVYGEGSTFTVKLTQKVIDEIPVKNYQATSIEKEEVSNESKPVNEIPVVNEMPTPISSEEIPNTNTAENVETTKEEQPIQSATETQREDKEEALLVVDDNNINLKVATKMLQGFNFEVDTAHSGFECLEKINSNKEKYDVVFMDIMMPDMDGVETMKKLKSIEGFHTPIIALTADSMDGSREKYLAVGFDDYVSKPIIKDLLEKALYKHIDTENITIVSKEEPQEQEEIL